MLPIYKSLVVQHYEKKRVSGLLTRRLEEPTPASLKKECVVVCGDNERYKRKDEKALMEFFGRHENQAAYIQVIKRFDRDKFKPLANYLKGESGSTEDKNIELLAWLIDFEPRPYEYGRRYDDENQEEPNV